MQHVPYKGASQAAIGVAGGEVAVAFQGLGTVTALMQAGKVKLIGVATPARLPQYPDVPTVGESGCRASSSTRGSRSTRPRARRSRWSLA
jgi:tripartite-type tricarboxylate transporter receptor subunit TctC